MQATGTETAAGRKRVEAVVETLAAIHNHGESLEELAHDARNMVTALSLYCDLLEEPGVLEPSHRHYGSELRLVAEASRRLVEKLALLNTPEPDDDRPWTAPAAAQGHPFGPGPAADQSLDLLGMEPLSDGLIDDLRSEIVSSRNLLSAIAGPSVSISVKAEGGAAAPVRMTGENLIRALVNLVRNAAEAIHGAGTIAVTLDERHQNGSRTLALAIEDNGCGIPAESLEKVFEAGYSTRAGSPQSGRAWKPGHRGLGLAITRSIVEAAGGRIHAENASGSGARFVMELPVRKA